MREDKLGLEATRKSRSIEADRMDSRCCFSGHRSERASVGAPIGPLKEAQLHEDRVRIDSIEIALMRLI